MTNASPDLHFSGRDTFPRFAVFFFVFGGGCVPIPFMIYHGLGLHAVAALFAVSVLVAIGLRFSIVVTSEGVQITRTWFGVPYWCCRGKVINAVFFGGDWGEAEGASGVVVGLDDREFHIGSGSTMHDLHEALLPLVTSNRKRPGRGS